MSLLWLSYLPTSRTPLFPDSFLFLLHCRYCQSDAILLCLAGMVELSHLAFPFAFPSWTRKEAQHIGSNAEKVMLSWSSAAFHFKKQNKNHSPLLWFFQAPWEEAGLMHTGCAALGLRALSRGLGDAGGDALGCGQQQSPVGWEAVTLRAAS